MAKEQIRWDMKQQRNSLKKQERDALDQAISYRLLQTQEYINCSELFVFVSFGTEVSTHEIIHQAFMDGKKVYVPRVEGNHMEFYLVLSLEGLIASKFGVPEPLPSEENRYHTLGDDYSDTTNITNPLRLMLIPGLAFDITGNRIGYGAGFYDKYLTGYLPEHFYKIALAYDFQVVEQFTSEEHDIKVDAIITQTTRLQCK